MRLESDATVAYVLGTNKIKHSLDDVRTDSPYNTYLYGGLPPGPVKNPSLDAIEATVYPLENDYVFFLHNPQTGEIFFSQTYEEHVRLKDLNGL
jgi:UPF0755 protein